MGLESKFSIYEKETCLELPELHGVKANLDKTDTSQQLLLGLL